MSDAILVVNAGSSSLKYSVFLEQGETLDLLLGGQIESLYTASRFKAKDAAGAAAWLGVELDPAANATGGPCISTADSRIPAWSFPPTRS